MNIHIIEYLAEPAPGRNKILDKMKMSNEIKRQVHIFDAAENGICHLNKEWVYAYDREGDAIDIRGARA